MSKEKKYNRGSEFMNIHYPHENLVGLSNKPSAPIIARKAKGFSGFRRHELSVRNSFQHQTLIQKRHAKNQI